MDNLSVHLSEKGALSSDKYAQDLLNNFLSEFVNKFSIINTNHRDLVLVQLLGMSPSELCKTERYNLLQRSEDLKFFEVSDSLRDVANFTVKWMSDNIRYQHIFEDHYKKEWKNTPLGENGYYTGQYNSMLINRTLKYIISMFVRKQMYLAYEKVMHDYYREEGNSCYIICKSGIDGYGLHHPNPTFKRDRGEEKEKPNYLSTEQPDIAILWKYFDQYKIIEFLPSGDHMLAKYYVQEEYTRILCALNKLKYEHFDMGDQPRRRVLNLKNKTYYMKEDLDPNKVIGKNYW